MCFSHVIFFFPLTVFPSAGFTPWPKDSHERGKGTGKGRVKEGKRKNRKGRGKGKGKENERKRKRKRKRKEKERNRTRKRKGKGKGEGKGRERKKDRKGRGKGEERERKERGKGEERKKRVVSHTDHFWCQKLSFSLSFCHRSWILCKFLFSGNGCNHQKRSLATTYQAPSLCRIWHAFVGAPLRQQTMKWSNQNH